MLNILIVDDERLARAELKRLLASYPSVKVVAEAENAVEAKQLLAAHAIDLVFLDIQMPEMTGLELAAELEPRLQFVFCTAYNSFALDAFALNALDYLVKPLDPHRLQKTIERASQRAVSQANGDQTTANYLSEQHGLLLKFGDINRIVRLHEISRFESIGNHTAVYTPFGKSFILSSLSRIESRLDPQLFLKVVEPILFALTPSASLNPALPLGLCWQHCMMVPRSKSVGGKCKA
jgi:two-component system LytT family response regulator